ncbi:MAG: integration host factor, partial [Acidimicrobiia bacterium]|nr:integration host factor [Acidimicrobiia bacterium]
MAPPELSDEQRQAALQKAADVRKVRAEVKQLLKMGTITFPEF